MTLGDSKTASGQWQPTLLNELHRVSGERWDWYNGGVSGATVASASASIATILSVIPNTSDPHVDVLCNWGANDVGALPAEATWKANYLAIIDAIVAKWPQAKVRLSRPWRRNYGSQCNTIAGWIADIVAARPGVASIGDDERAWLEHGDDGATRTSDGIHYNDAGNPEKAAQALATTGY